MMLIGHYFTINCTILFVVIIIVVVTVLCASTTPWQPPPRHTPPLTVVTGQLATATVQRRVRGQIVEASSLGVVPRFYLHPILLLRPRKNQQPLATHFARQALRAAGMLVLVMAEALQQLDLAVAVLNPLRLVYQLPGSTASMATWRGALESD